MIPTKRLYPASAKPTVALIFGGIGAEHDVSVAGAEFLLPLISPRRYRRLPILIAKDGRWLIAKHGIDPSPRELEEFSKRKRSKTQHSTSREVSEITLSVRDRGGILTESGFLPIDCAIPLVHGDFGEDGTVGGALRSAKIPFVGCDVTSSAAACDKIYAKIIAESLGIPTARWCFGEGLSELEETKAVAEAKFGYPMFIKPARLGSSVGISKVDSEDDFESAYRLAESYDRRVLIEEALSLKSELECAYIGLKCKQLFTKIGEIHNNGGFYDYDKKYSKDSKTEIIFPTELDSKYGETIRKYSAMLRRAVGISQLSRFDFFLTTDGKICFNEINTIPGFTETSLYPKLAASAGLSPERLTDLFIRDRLRGRK